MIISGVHDEFMAYAYIHVHDRFENSEAAAVDFLCASYVSLLYKRQNGLILT